MKGKYIVIEGGDGCGKSTQKERLVSYLKDKGFTVGDAREPGGTVVAEDIRKVLLAPRSSLVDPKAELLLFGAARAEIFSRVIKPALRDGQIIVADRSFFSTIAYQGYARGINRDIINTINTFAMDGIVPDVTIIIDVEPKKARITTTEFNQKDRFENETAEFHEKVRRGYLEVAKQFSNVHVIQFIPHGEDEMQKQIRTIVEQFLK